MKPQPETHPRTAAENVSAEASWSKLIIELGPLLVFFAVNAFAGIFAGTAAFMAATLLSLAVAHFRGKGGGKIVNIASRAAHRGDAPDQWPYAASKGALVALTKTIARGYAAENILAFAVAPGFTETDMAYVGMTDADIRRILSEIPLGSMASAEEVGALVAFLCADQVRHMTGATFDINGASYVR